MSKNCFFNYRFLFFTNIKKTVSEEKLYDYTYQNTSNWKTSEFEYTTLIKKVSNKGCVRDDRSGTGTVSLFGETMKFDIKTFVPLLTTKSVPWKMAIEELLWMLRGSTDSKELEAKGIKIWKGHTSTEFLKSRGLDYPEGSLKFGYGHQMRNAGGDTINCKNCGEINTIEGFDQLKYIEHQLKTDPFSRRILWNLWTANQIDKMPLPPCHLQVQFYVEESCIPGTSNWLSGMVYLRSNDLFLGSPFNIFAYTVLIYILAKKCNLVPKELTVVIGDAHIYSNHLNQITEQLSRTECSQPILTVSNDIIDLDWGDITIEYFELIGYYPHPRIAGMMAI